MTHEETTRLLNRSAAEAPRKLLHQAAVSIASAIAAIDSDSNRVVAYLETRLEPLLAMAAMDVRCWAALEQIRDDARDPVAMTDAAASERWS